MYPTETKALSAGFGTAVVAILGNWANQLNDLSITFAPLLTAIGVLGGLGLTATYYILLFWARRKEFQTRERERRLKHLQREHEQAMMDHDRWKAEHDKHSGG